MTLWSRIMYTVNAAVSAWREEAFIPQDYEWDSYNHRQARYYLAMHYYSNTAYRDVNAYAATIRKTYKLYRHLRGVYNPVERLVEGTVSAVYGGMLDPKLLDGALPVETDDSGLRDNISQILQWSQFGRSKSLFARDVALFGDGLLKVVDSDNKVRLEVLDPRKVKHLVVDALGLVTYCEIEYKKPRNELDDESTLYEYRQVITPDEVTEYEDDEEVSRVRNPYGFVPVVLANYRETAHTFGINAFQNQLGKIDTINDAASLINDSIRNVIQPVYALSGASGGGLGTNANEPSRDDVRLLYVPSGATINPLVAPIDTMGAMAALQSQLDELERDLPVLALHKMREMSSLTAPAVKAAYSDAIKRIEEVQGNCDNALQRALNMALIIGEQKGLWQTPLTDIDTAPYNIKPRPLVTESTTLQEKIAILQALDPNNPFAAMILEELGYDADAIAAAQERNDVNRFARIEESLLQRRTSPVDDLIAQGQTSLPSAQPIEQDMMNDDGTAL